MRIDQLRVQNFKRFSDRTLDLHPRFTLLVGDNGAGKTTFLDALAIAAGIWLVKPPDSMLCQQRTQHPAQRDTSRHPARRRSLAVRGVQTRVHHGQGGDCGPGT